jgi:hypothetical protein
VRPHTVLVEACQPGWCGGVATRVLRVAPSTIILCNFRVIHPRAPPHLCRALLVTPTRHHRMTPEIRQLLRTIPISDPRFNLVASLLLHTQNRYPKFPMSTILDELPPAEICEEPKPERKNKGITQPHVKWEKKQREPVNSKFLNVPPNPLYYFEDGLRKVNPYNFTYNTFCKERWRGRSLLDIFADEFRERPLEYYVGNPLRDRRSSAVWVTVRRLRGDCSVVFGGRRRSSTVCNKLHIANTSPESRNRSRHSLRNRDRQRLDKEKASYIRPRHHRQKRRHDFTHHASSRAACYRRPYWYRI